MARYVKVEAVLAAAVATSGTFTITYPTGTSRGEFLGGVDHRLTVGGIEAFIGRDFTISFGATTATVTWRGASTIPAGTAIRAQLDRAGTQLLRIPRAVDSETVRIDLGSPATLSNNALIKAATSTNLPNASTKSFTWPATNVSPLDGAIQDGVFDVPRTVYVNVTHGSSIVAMTIKVWGLDEYYQAMYEEISVTATGTSKNFNGVKAFKRVSRVDVTASGDATTNTLNVGFGNKLGLPVFLPDTTAIIEELAQELPVGRRVRYTEYINQTDLLAPTAHTIVVGFNGTITAVKTVTTTAVGTGGTITAAINGVAVTGGVVTVANSAAVGDNDIAIPTAANAVVPGDTITLTPASFATTGALFVEVDIEPAYDHGTAVAGSRVQGSATSADVRGTYTPPFTPDGSIAAALIVRLADPTYLGVPQYTA